MRLSRIYTDRVLSVGVMVQLDAAESHYLARVLRLSVGDPVVLFNGDGNDYTGQVEEAQRAAVRILLSDSYAAENESPLRITLCQAISRGERMDYCLQKAAELGVYCIQPLLSERVEVRLDKKRLEKRLTHWRGVLVSACEQSGRAYIPAILQPTKLAAWLATQGDSECLLLDLQAETKLKTYAFESSEISILVGPEGGFSNNELVLARASGAVAVSLGPRVLRTETAGPVAIAVLQSVAGDL